VAPALFPLQLFDPAWQLRLAGTLINTAAFPPARPGPAADRRRAGAP
jgi:hypothetical protein